MERLSTVWGIRVGGGRLEGGDKERGGRGAKKGVVGRKEEGGGRGG